ATASLVRYHRAHSALPSFPTRRSSDLPVIEDDVVRNAAGTILGADDKAAVAAMLEATRRVLAENRRHAGIELLFTPKEEVGLIGDRKSTRLNSSHRTISYAVFCLKKKT